MTSKLDYGEPEFPAVSFKGVRSAGKKFFRSNNQITQLISSIPPQDLIFLLKK